MNVTCELEYLMCSNDWIFVQKTYLFRCMWYMCVCYMVREAQTCWCIHNIDVQSAVQKSVGVYFKNIQKQFSCILVKGWNSLCLHLCQPHIIYIDLITCLCGLFGLVFVILFRHSYIYNQLDGVFLCVGWFSCIKYIEYCCRTCGVNVREEYANFKYI